MSLRNAFVPSSALTNQVRRGLGGLQAVDVPLIHEGQRRRVRDSLDLDAAMLAQMPQENRWDYLVSLVGNKEIIGIEPHSASDSEIRVVIAKKDRARLFLANHLRPGNSVARWLWVSHGPVTFSRMERARRLLDQNGIGFSGRLIRSFG